MRDIKISVPGVGTGLVSLKGDVEENITDLSTLIEELEKQKDKLMEEQKEKERLKTQRELYLMMSGALEEAREYRQGLNDRGIVTMDFEMRPIFPADMGKLEQSVFSKLKKAIKKEKDIAYVVLRHARKTRKGNLVDARIYGICETEFAASELKRKVLERERLNSDQVTYLKFKKRK